MGGSCGGVREVRRVFLGGDIEVAVYRVRRVRGGEDCF